MYFDTSLSEKIAHRRSVSKRTFCLSSKVAGLSQKNKQYNLNKVAVFLQYFHFVAFILKIFLDTFIFLPYYSNTWWKRLWRKSDSKPCNE